jgi:hypothetical protein
VCSSDLNPARRLNPMRSNPPGQIVSCLFEKYWLTYPDQTSAWLLFSRP